MLEYFPAPSSQPDTRKKETDPKLIRPQQAITESYLQGTENWKLGSAARDEIKKRRRPARLEEQRTETAATALTWPALLPSAPASGVSKIFSSSFHFSS